MADENHDGEQREEQSGCAFNGGSRWTLAAVVALLGFAPGAAGAAVAIYLRPGAAEPCDVNVNRNDIAGSLADLDQYVGSSLFDWAIVNDGSPATASLPDPEHVFFQTNSGTSILQAGGQFDMSFTMALTSLGSGGPIYGQDDPMASLFLDDARTTVSPSTVPYPSHVVMTASLEGMITVSSGLPSFPVHSLVRAAPTFTKGEFRMFFDEDGDRATTSDRVLIAKFGAYAPPAPASSFAGTTFIDQAVGAVIVNWDAALPGVFTDAAANEIALGAPDSLDPTLRGVNSATQPSQIEVDFKFECATSGGCAEMDAANHLRMRLHMLAGYNSVYSVPATTTPPAPLCPPVLQKLKVGVSPCFPYAFCDIASIKVKLPGPQYETAPVVVTPAVVPVQTATQVR